MSFEVSDQMIPPLERSVWPLIQTRTEIGSSANGNFESDFDRTSLPTIMRGRQPMNLTAEALTRRVEIPFEWRSQKEALNIP
jgi:hypothetical protein